MTMDVPCQETDTIKCTHCNSYSLVGDLRKVRGNKFPVPEKNGSFWQERHYYCPFCDDTYAKVYDRGDDTPLILGANVEIVGVGCES